MSDDRLKKSAENRESRAMQDRAVTESRALTEDDRLELFRQQLFQSALPDLPQIPGWHLCWLTTTNPRDSIHARLRLGYEPVKPEDIPGWQHATVKTGEYAGFIGVNEMLAFKLPQSLYLKFMQEAHHDAPLREEEKLTDTADFLEQQARSSKSRLDVGEGTSGLAEKRQARFELA
jgi:hypothetical protein